MPSTHLSLHYHLIFSTKDRRPLIGKDWRGRLHAFLGGAVKECGGIPEAVGGVDDHVHPPSSSHQGVYMTRPTWYLEMSRVITRLTSRSASGPRTSYLKRGETSISAAALRMA